MNYYIIDWDYENKDAIGNYPQIEIGDNNNFKDPDNARKVKPYMFPNFVPKLNLKFHEKAKVTNLIDRSSVNFGMFVDDAFKSILQNFNLPSHKFYEIKVFQKNKCYDYFWFHYLSDNFWESLDKKKTEVVIVDIVNNHKVVDSLNLDMSEEEIKLYTTFDLSYNHKLKWKKIVFKKGFPKYDLIKTENINYTTIISEDLLKSLEGVNMTGFTTKPFCMIEFQ
ncbi:hypothetical protein [Tenacibaculum maritimum]|uniref:hypothetical protein n=3 Tax=Tenacibaculum maritimum TaxID=107401 RepID=UPI0004288DC9|nr:hypothetical protein [Tenacibaculum maritimum]